VFPVFDVFAAVQDEIEARNKQIEQLQQEIEAYQQQIDTHSGTARTLASEISKLNSRISQLQLEIRSLGLTIEQTGAEIGQTQEQIEIARQQIEIQKKALGRYIMILDKYDHENLATIFFKSEKLSGFFDNLQSVKDTQEKARTSIVRIQDLQADLENKQTSLEDKKEELEKIKALQESQKNNLNGDKSYKDKLLKTTKGEEARYQKLVKDSKAQIEAIRSQITYLLQNGISVEDAIKYGQLAAIKTGVRPAYLIAVLEVESGLGKNVGKCNREGDPASKGWRVIMHTRDHKPFQTITAELGLNIDTTPVSCPQYSNGKQFGWGGAMGPAQFIPSTWMGYKDEVASLLNRQANPWNIEDAFLAAALKLKRAGADARTKAAEIAASKAYYSGNSSCSKVQCKSYANAIQNKAAIIEQNL
jgi:peptidoglycan hydrolase CwlO-like protein